MGCSATKSSTVLLTNNNNAIKTQKKSNNHEDDPNGCAQNPVAKIEHRKKPSSDVMHNQLAKQPLLELEDEISEGINQETAEQDEDDGDDEVFRPNKRSIVVKKEDEMNQVGDEENARNLANNVPLSGSLHVGKTDFSRSQSDFFKMLDEKIAKGQSLSSTESIR